MSLRKPEWVTFDVAQTLVAVEWDPVRLTAECAAEELGVHLSELQGPAQRYYGMLKERWPGYLQLNQTGTVEDADAWWEDLARDWGTAEGYSESAVEGMLDRAIERLYGASGTVFRAYADAVPTLEGVRERGVKMAVVSNWDLTLERVLRMTGMWDYFAYVGASDVFGAGKPDVRFFDHVLNRVGAQAAVSWHVGDDYEADIVGAHGAGYAAAWHIVRSGERGARRVTDLTQVLEEIDQCD